ncbi:MAG TPA: hypothetical protein VI818_05295, partial [Candidatus Thermoplasmatota archaeon]|nr:hypothetical protein [Candidatus Thermoplasmatota archaeon]
PSIGVDIRNTRNLVFAALHGNDADGPSRHSRSGLPFTTFVSTDHGATWRDNFFSPPAELRGAFGEYPQLVNDPYGQIYVGSLYSRSTEGRGANAKYDYVLAAQKFENFGKINQHQTASNGGYNVQYLDPFIEDNMISQFWYIFDHRLDKMAIVWHEQPPPQQTAQAPAAPATSVIGFAWTSMGMKTPYLYAPSEYLMGPCSASTNPVWSEGWIYVGCIADPTRGDFAWNPKTASGTVELFRFKIDDDAPEYLGSSPIVGGTPKLGVRTDGRLALFSAGPSKEGRSQLVGVFGHYKHGRIDWGDLVNYSPKIPRGRVDEKILESNIQDLQYREYSGAVHLILKERVTHTSVVSVDKPLEGVAGPQFRKQIVAIDEIHGWLANHNFDIGNPSNITDPLKRKQYGENELLFDDISDDILQLPPRNYTYKGQKLGETYMREFIAIGDYGVVQFAEVIEITNLRPPGLPPPAAPAIALAAPALATTASAVLLPLGGTAFAGLLAFALLANRRKNINAAIAKGGK